MSEIENRLRSLNKRMKTFYDLIHKAGNTRLLKNLPRDLTKFLFLLNIQILENDHKEEFSLFLTRDVQKFFRGHSRASDLTIIGNKNTWLRVLDGNSSLFGEIIKGNLSVPNLKLNWPKAFLFSHLLTTLTSSKISRLLKE
ncbi:MAG: hypothetical protein ACXQS8_03395 [Candidatus Helarchaeales archaeon]